MCLIGGGFAIASCQSAITTDDDIIHRYNPSRQFIILFVPLPLTLVLRPRPHEAETGETVTVSIYPVSQYLRKDGVKRNRVDL